MTVLQRIRSHRPGDPASITVRRRRTGLARLSLLVCVTLVTAALLPLGTGTAGAASTPTPANDPFYTPPSPLPAGQPGDVIRSRPSVFTLDPFFKTPVTGVKAWQVLYRSTSATGAPIAVSGTVLVPTSRWLIGRRPLVSYGVGTRGVGDQCAPSYTLSQGLDYEGLFIRDALSRGWAVAVTDMEGLGTPGAHTYEVGRSQGHAVLDIARAAQRLSGTGLSALAPVGLWGYSQGGTSVGWAAELAPTYAPELKLKGVAASGVPADLTAVAEFLDGSPFVALALMAALGYDTAYPELDLEQYLNSEGQALLAKSRDMCLVSFDGIATVLQTAFTRIGDYTTTNPLTTPAWQARLGENKLGSGRPRVPVFQTHALFDEMVAFGQAATLRRDWCNRGVNVTWKAYPIAEHVLGMLQSEQDSLNFLGARFAGWPTWGNCWLP